MLNGFMSSSSLSKSVTTLLCYTETGGVLAPEWQKLTGEDISARSSRFFLSLIDWLSAGVSFYDTYIPSLLDSKLSPII